MIQCLSSINISGKHFIGVDSIISWGKIKLLKTTDMFKNVFSYRVLFTSIDDIHISEN